MKRTTKPPDAEFGTIDKEAWEKNKQFFNTTPEHPLKRMLEDMLPTYRILSIDTATHCGWAIARNIYGVWNLTPRRDEGAGMRLVRFRSKFKEIIESEKINLVVFERPGGRNKGSVIVQSELQGQIKEVCEVYKIPYRGYSSKEIKKFATGNGNAGKPAMVAAAQKKLEYPGDNDNEADALWMLELAKSEYK